MKHAPLITLWALIPVLPLLFSCGSAQKVVYFNHVQDSVIRMQAEAIDPAISKNDILSIAVTSLSPEASAMFNMPNLPAGSAFGASSTSLGTTGGYLVNEEGNIQFPVLGLIKAEGLSKRQLSQAIRKQLIDKKLLLDPIVGVRQLNFHVTVLGEVNRPTVVAVANEKINILEALGFAGDLTLFANRDNVLLIREEDGNRIVKRIDLNSSSALASPYYSLRSGDIIYAEPNKTRVRSTSETRQMLPIVMSGISVLIIALDRLLR